MDLNLFRKFVLLCAGRTGQLLNMASLANEGVEHVCLTVWSEDGDQILRKLDEFQTIAEQTRTLL